ncbi:DUF501 domain-containing protein [Gulosibacter macacae]|uniref:DUF501 domain-containing protein n=1 Tax=Gulosibacter macacae TaxID=2488791 RepID=A0A3P3VUD2_9MICO|nr:DUF501 domain-containing protein [Gulosibacter macacae]RRJ86411.1 DUF501 domain-containing protein [Gulosibacter macacae]
MTQDAQSPFPPATERDIAVVTAQLGRPARGVLGVGARCVCGNPVVVITAPRLDDGTPFPTLYYLTHPEATAEMSRLEVAHLMVEMQDALATDPELQAAYQRAHEQYLAQREAVEHVAEIANVTAGGMPTRVKCLHALAGHALAAGPGVNPMGDWALRESAWSPERCQCDDPGAALRAE